MRLCHLELTDYRCYEKAQLSFPAGITVISGRNAQGKTNLLESVFLCCAGKSHRGAKEEEMIRMEYGENYGMWIESSPGAGTKVTYLLPVIRGIQK